MRDLAKSFWSTNTFAAISFTCSLVEVMAFLIGIVLAVFFHVPFKRTPALLGIVWIFGTAAAIISALIGLIANPRKEISAAALLTAMGCFMLCGTQMLV